MVEGEVGFQWKKRNKRKELGKTESKRKRIMEEGGNVDTLCWPVCKLPRSSSCSFCDFGSHEEKCEAVGVSAVFRRSVASLGLIRSSSIYV